METPPIWSDNIVRNFERVREWTEAVFLMCDINSDEYKYYIARCTQKISRLEMQSVIVEFGSNFGLLLDWIECGILCINANNRLPEECQLTPLKKMDELKTLWQAHITNERKILDDLKNEMSAVKEEVKIKLQMFYDEASDGYSSYSDYSEETSEDEEEEETDRRNRKKEYKEEEEEEEEEEEDEEEEEGEEEEEEEEEEVVDKRKDVRRRRR